MKKGFTLSEVLITLGIVGVVAVLTVPGVMKNYKNRLYTSQLQKVYSQISDAAQAVMNDQHVDNFYETTVAADNSCSNAAQGICEKGVGLFLNNYFKPLKKNCQTGSERCVAASYTTIKSEAISHIETTYCIQNTNGATICAKGKNPIDLLVDVNGPASPNMVGRDVFSMLVNPDGTVVDYDPNKKACDGANKSHVSLAAQGCLNAIIDAGWKMNY